MIATLLLSALLTQQDLNVPDPVSSFKYSYLEGAKDIGAVDVPRGIELAHRLWKMVPLPEDQRPAYYENSIISNGDAGFVSMHYRGLISFSFSAKTGRLFAFGADIPSSLRQPNLSVDDCVAKVKEFYKELGGKCDLVVDRAYIDKDPQEVYVNLEYAAPGTGYRLGAGVESIVDRTYGTPVGMQISEPPAFDMPAHVRSKADAESAAVTFAFASTGWSVTTVASQDAKFHVPDYRSLPNRLNEHHKQRIKDRKACLIYEVTVQDASVEEVQGQLRPFIQVYVDAETGEPIAVFPASERMGGRTFKHKAFAWGANAWQVGKAKGPVAVADAAAPKSGKPVVVRQGILAVKAQYDAKSGLLWTVSDGKTTVGKPDAALRNALAKAKAPKEYTMRRDATPAKK